MRADHTNFRPGEHVFPVPTKEQIKDAFIYFYLNYCVGRNVLMYLPTSSMTFIKMNHEHENLKKMMQIHTSLFMYRESFRHGPTQTFIHLASLFVAAFLLFSDNYDQSTMSFHLLQDFVFIYLKNVLV